MRIEKFFQHLDILIIGVAGIVVTKVTMLHLKQFLKRDVIRINFFGRVLNGFHFLGWRWRLIGRVDI